MEELHPSWLIDSMVNIGNSFGRTVEISVEIWTLDVFSIWIVVGMVVSIIIEVFDTVPL